MTTIRCFCGQFDPVLSRRDWLRQSAAGFGYLALAGLLTDGAGHVRAAGGTAANPLAPQAAAFHAAGQARHLSVHARRTVAGRYLRLQAAARSRPRQTAAVCQAARRFGEPPATC